MIVGGSAGLVLLRANPLNCETPISALMGGMVMPNERFYVRNHFAAPALDGARWRLQVGGLVRRPLRLGLRDLVNLPAQVQTVKPARLLGQGSTYGWQRWELITRVDGPGRITVRARATDQVGRSQPERPEWNRLGYGNNAVHEVSIRAKHPPAGRRKISRV